jgi:hypothetical protein
VEDGWDVEGYEVFSRDTGDDETEEEEEAQST